MNHEECGKNVIDGEIAALKVLRDGIDKNFTNAVQCIKTIRGKVIITGIGKSGHIGRKIAATFASLGTPSFFVHAAEAMHGDMGMIQKSDVVIAISNSGTTTEVVETATKSSQIGAKVIAITGRADSPLGKSADIILIITVSSEADHLNLAPTSSSTVTLALGDALAVAVSGAKGFTAEQFGFLHAGGALGKKSNKK